MGKIWVTASVGTSPITKFLAGGGFSYNVRLSTGSDQFEFRWRNTSASIFSVLTDLDSLIPNTWHHVVCVFDGSNIHIYWDGKLHNSTSVTGTTVTNEGDLFIGSLSGSTDVFDGLIDDVRIYNRALSPEEIQRLYRQ